MKKHKNYKIDQCALYKIGSKNRLAKILEINLKELIALSKQQNNYRIFSTPEETCPFTGKYRNARQVQEPKPILKKLHRRVQKLISRIEVPKYANAAIKGRSYRSNAEAHIKANQIATLDIRRFYPSTSKSLVRDFFAEQLHCAPDVADLLTDLSCYVFNSPEGPSIGLPTGSPLSPILSLHANKPMFEKLQDYAYKHNLMFTCYIDDITFSGVNLPTNIVKDVERIIYNYGHKIASDKTKVFRGHTAKHVTGIAIYENEIRAPHSRFKKARAIEIAIKETDKSDAKKLIQLREKLAGLLSEMAYLDAKLKPWAANVTTRLNKYIHSTTIS